MVGTNGIQGVKCVCGKESGAKAKLAVSVRSVRGCCCSGSSDLNAIVLRWK